MSAKVVYRWRVWCTGPPARWEYVYSDVEPTVCPSDGGAIDSSKTVKIDTIGPNPVTVSGEVDTGISFDAFGRARVSQLITNLEMRQLGDAQPLIVDTVTNGTGTSTYTLANSATTLATAASGDYVIRQTYATGVYQNGKSHLLEISFSGFESETNVIKRVGYFSSSTTAPYTASLDGLFLESNDTGIYFRVYRSGTLVDSAEQANWDDPCDGSIACPTIDWTKTQLMVVDIQWLGVGRVALHLVVGEVTYRVHTFYHANTETLVYMTSPNQPMRWSIRQTGAGSGSFDMICCAVHTEGGLNEITNVAAVSTGTNTVNANSAGTYYALVGLRLKASRPDARVNLTGYSILAVSADAYHWEIRLNPTVAGTFTYTDVTNYPTQHAIGDTAGNPSTNTVTGGTILSCGFGSGSNTGEIASAIDTFARALGVSINGTLDTYVLCVSPISGFANLDVGGALRYEVSL